MKDHAPRIRAQQQQEVENAESQALASRAAVLFWAIYVALALLIAGWIVDAWHSRCEQVSQNEALAQCLNGRAIAIGDAVLRCKVSNHRLVAGVKS